MIAVLKISIPFLLSFPLFTINTAPPLLPFSPLPSIIYTKTRKVKLSETKLAILEN